MQELRGMHQHDIVVSNEDVCVSGMVAGDLVIEGASHVELKGMVRGSVRLRGGSLYVRGMVGGDIDNNGGQLTIRGMVKGTVRTVAGTTSVEHNALDRPDRTQSLLSRVLPR